MARRRESAMLNSVHTSEDELSILWKGKASEVEAV